MQKSKRGRVGRPATLTIEERQEQLRAGKAAHRARAKGSGKVRLDVTVDGRTKAALEAYRDQHDLLNLGAALDALLLEKD